MNKVEKVTVEEVLADENFKHLSREEAEEYVQTLERYCELMFQMWLDKENGKLGKDFENEDI